MADKYTSFDELKRLEPVRAYRIEVRDVGSRIAILAPHGGGIEPGTSEVSRAIARDDLSLYLFEGLKKRANSDLHITSTRIDEPHCLQLLRAVDVVVAVHGEGGNREVVYLGGLHLELGERIGGQLEAQGFRVERHASALLQGTDPANVCNRGARGSGVQLELSAGLRRTFFASLLSASGRTHTTERFALFNSAVRAALAGVPHGLAA